MKDFARLRPEERRPFFEAAARKTKGPAAPVIKTPEQEAEWRRDYREMKEMFFTDPPSFEEILETLKEFEDKFNQM